MKNILFWAERRINLQLIQRPRLLFVYNKIHINYT